MPEPNHRRSTIVVAAAAVVVLAVAAGGLIVTSRANGQSGRNADEQRSQGAGGDASADWQAMMAADRVLIRAKDVQELKGLMVRGEDLDNESVTNAAGERAKVDFVWVRDNMCGKEEEVGEERSEHLAIFQFEVKAAGSYHPWARVWWTDGCGNSARFWLQREGEEPVVLHRADNNTEIWQWVPLMSTASSLALKPGSHILTFDNREDGARVSRVLLTTSKSTPTNPEG